MIQRLMKHYIYVILFQFISKRTIPIKSEKLQRIDNSRAQRGTDRAKEAGGTNAPNRAFGDVQFLIIIMSCHFNVSLHIWMSCVCVCVLAMRFFRGFDLFPATTLLGGLARSNLKIIRHCRHFVCAPTAFLYGLASCSRSRGGDHSSLFRVVFGRLMICFLVWHKHSCVCVFVCTIYYNICVNYCTILCLRAISITATIVR